MNRLKFIFSLLTILLPGVLAAVPPEKVTNVHVADRTRYVTDMPGVLSPTARTRVDSIMSDIWRQTTAEPVVVIIDKLDGRDIDDYATALFDLWKPGKKDKDNGVILLIAMEDRKFALRTGYGAEGILPDILCAGILNEGIKPHFRQEDYDGGVIEAATRMHSIMTDPEAREELLSKYSNDSQSASGADSGALFNTYLILSAIIALLGLVLYIVNLFKIRKEPTAEAYHVFERSRLLILVLTFLTLGMMLPVLGLWLLTMRRIRNKPRHCPNCDAIMHKLDEQTDNIYLDAAQDAEERLDSVDYDVWLCPECNTTEVIPFINRKKNYNICPHCGARTEALTSSAVVVPATTAAAGRGVRNYRCFHCNNQRTQYYNIPKLQAPVVIIPPGGGGRFGGGGGGFSGGSFGGGMTGGGGASGGW